MSCRNIDFYAVCLSVLVLTGLSQAPNIRVFRPVDPVRLQNAVNVSSTRFQESLDSRVDCFQKRLDEHFNRIDSRFRDIDSRFSRLLNQ